MAKRIPDEDAQALIETAGFTPLEKYPGSMAPWKMKCSSGHHVSKTYTSIRQGHKCIHCEKELNGGRIGEARRLSDEEAMARASECGFEITDPNPYPGSMEKWGARCSNGHDTHIRVGDLPRYGCNACGNLVGASKRKLSDETAVGIMKQFGFTPLEEYNGTKARWKSQCSVGHVVSPNLQNVRRGHGCFVCKTLSHSTRTKLNGSELPGYLYLIRFIDKCGTPFLKVGIGLSGGTSNRLAEHGRFGGEVVEVVHTTRELSYTTEQEILRKYRSTYSYQPTSTGSWGSGTECLTDNCPIQLTDWF